MDNFQANFKKMSLAPPPTAPPERCRALESGYFSQFVWNGPYLAHPIFKIAIGLVCRKIWTLRPGLYRALSHLPASWFFDEKLRSLSDCQNVVQGPPKSKQWRPKRSQQQTKALNTQNMKWNQCIYCGLNISSPHLATPRAQKTHSDAGTQKYLPISIDFNWFGLLLGSRGGPKNHHFVHILDSAPFGRPLGAHGRQKTPTDTKMTL